MNKKPTPPLPTGMASCSPTGTQPEDTDFGYTMSLIGGKYKMTILFWLSHLGTVRFNELQRCIGSISFKTLSAALKELEADKLVIRREYPQIPPKVEYSLSARGQSLLPVLSQICAWGKDNRPPQR
jgi:DNA-binding HxlR family transcriptional regulator